MNKIRISIYKARGRYNLLRDDYQEQVIVRIVDGDDVFGVSEIWDDGESPDIDDMSLIEVIDEIASQINRRWISTSREKKLANCERIRNTPRYTMQWLRQRAIAEQEKAAKAHDRAALFLYELADLNANGWEA